MDHEPMPPHDAQAEAWAAFWAATLPLEQTAPLLAAVPALALYTMQARAAWRVLQAGEPLPTLLLCDVADAAVAPVVPLGECGPRVLRQHRARQLISACARAAELAWHGEPEQAERVLAAVGTRGAAFDL